MRAFGVARDARIPSRMMYAYSLPAVKMPRSP